MAKVPVGRLGGGFAHVGAPGARTRAEFHKAAVKLNKLAGGLKNKAPHAVRSIGEDIMTDVKTSRPGAGVPKDTGVLAGSGQVEGPTNGQVTLSFGGAAAPYALVQHENTDYAHRLGEPRYLIRGIERWQPGGVSAAKAYAEMRAEIKRLGLG